MNKPVSALIKYDIWNHDHHTCIRGVNTDLDYIKVILMGYDKSKIDTGAVHIMFKSMRLCRILNLTGCVLYESDHDYRFNLIAVDKHKDFLIVHKAIKKYNRYMCFHYHVEREDCYEHDYLTKMQELIL